MLSVVNPSRIQTQAETASIYNQQVMVSLRQYNLGKRSTLIYQDWLTQSLHSTQFNRYTPRAKDKSNKHIKGANTFD